MPLIVFAYKSYHHGSFFYSIFSLSLQKLHKMKKVLIDGQAVPMSETKTVMNFSAPTPDWASKLFNIWLTLSMIAGLAVVTFADEIPDNTEAIINKSLLFATGAVRIITKAFGLEVKEN